MEKDEKKVVETVENPTEVNEETVVTPEQDENAIVDNNTELDSSDYNPDEQDAQNPNPIIVPDDDVIPATVNDPVVDAPVEDPTLAPTDDIIPAPETDVVNPVDTTIEPVVDPVVDPVIDVPGAEPVSADVPVGTEPVVSEPVIPEDPAVIVPENPDACCACPECPEGEDGCDGTCACPSSSVTIGNFFGTLQECVTIVWRFHLKTRKHHVHVTLNEFYEKALDIVDDIIEQYQGICGVCEEPFINCIVGDGKSEGEYLTELKAFVENNKCVLGDHSEINSTIDEFLALIDSTNYKLIAFTESAVKSFDGFVYEDYPAIKESCKYDRFGNRSCDDPDDEDYDPEMENGECGAEEE